SFISLFSIKLQIILLWGRLWRMRGSDTNATPGWHGWFIPSYWLNLKMITRLFDIVARRTENDPTGVLLSAKENGEWRTYSSREVWDTASRLCGGLLGLDLANQDLT